MVLAAIVAEGGCDDNIHLGSDSEPMCLAPLLPASVAPTAFLAAGTPPGTLPDMATEDEGGAAAGPEGGGGVPYPQDGELLGRFLAGYDAAGGPVEYRDSIIAVVNCESTWDPGAVSDAGQLGLLQFEPSTWASYARSDMVWTDPYAQGWTGANLIGDLLDRGISPGSSAGWEWCWWR